MRYGQIRKYDIANGTGIRSTLFVTGCTHKCYNCFNEEYQNFLAGEEWSGETEAELLSYIEDANVEGLTILGGEPFQNLDGLIPFVEKVRSKFPQKTIWVYSGYTYEEIMEDVDRGPEMLSHCDVLVDGRYEDALRDPALAFRGSSNQRLIDLKKTRQEGKIILLDLN